MRVPDIRQFLRNLDRVLRPFAPLFKRAVTFVLAMQILSLAEPYLASWVVNGIVTKNAAVTGHLPEIGLGTWLLLSLIGAVNVRKNRAVFDLVWAVERDVPTACGEKLLRLPLSYHLRENTGVVVGKITRGVGKAMELIAVTLFDVAPLAFQVVITSVILSFLYPAALLVLLPVVVGFVAYTLRLKARWVGSRLERHALDNVADELIGQAVTNVMTVQAFAQQDREMDAMRQVRGRMSEMVRREFDAYDKGDVLRNSIISFGRAGVVYACASAAFGAGLSMGTFVLVYTLGEKIFLACYRIGSIVDRLMETVDPVMHMAAILDAPETVKDPAEAIELPSRPARAVSFENVSYAYSAGKEALCRLTLDIRPGETIGLVGLSGSGKSTLVKLLLRFDDPTGGVITVDGIDIRLLSLTGLRRMIGYVPQEVEINDATVAENIAYGRPDASRDEIEAAARAANAHDFIQRLERGYDTLVGNRGLRLSGGERQRLGIARALLTDPSILVMDEATSNVDSESELKIHQALAKVRAGRTVIMIAHRLSTIQDADRIAVMGDGRIEEIGTHRQLVDGGGMYHRLVAIQQGAFASV